MQIPKLREWRRVRGLSQKELAEKAGISERSVAGYEAGGGARPSTTRKLAAALGVEVADLFGEPAETGKAQAPPRDAEAPAGQREARPEGSPLNYEDARNVLAYLDQQVARVENGKLSPEKRAELREDLVTTGNAIAELMDESQAVGLLRRSVGMMHRLEEVARKEAEAKQRRLTMLRENRRPESEELTLDAAREAYEKLRLLLRRMVAGEFSPEERRWLFEHLVGTMLAMRRDLTGPEARELYAAYLDLYDRMGAALERERERAEDESRAFAEMRVRLAG